LRTEGPIVLETDFPQDQPVVDRQQNLVWTARMGRHAWLCYGVDAQDRLSCQNSSGVHWNEAEGGRLSLRRRLSQVPKVWPSSTARSSTAIPVDRRLPPILPIYS
jgi:hypothetical protein